MALPVLIAVLAFSTNEKFIVSGTITDDSGKALGYAIVQEEGATTQVSADGYGYYSIAAKGKDAVLVFSAVGYQTKKENVKGRSVVNISLAASKAALDEVMVTAAYDERKQSRLVAVKGVAINGFNSYPAPSYQEDKEYNTEAYDFIEENGFRMAKDHPLSTFSIDVDAASYSNVRRMLNGGQQPPAGAVRIEEMINYFKYEYPQPAKDQPFLFTTELSDCPWNAGNKLLLIGMQGKEIPVENLPASNLVFLIDVSGSMNAQNKLPLVKASLKMLTNQLRQQDRVSIVVYAGAAGLVLPPTNGNNKATIANALENLEAGGSTAGGEGIKLAYETARKNFKEHGNNRVILCTDGDFNVGESSDDAMVRLIEKERNSGVYLTVLGYGMGNYKDSKMQKLADKGNGNHAYIDGMNEAKKVLVSEFGGTLFTIAKDVKMQLEFNPAKVKGYRLIGYENRMLNKEDFNDDKKDAGELGSGHTVTALYEIIPVGVESPFLKSTDPLKYQQETIVNNSSDLATIKFRYKVPGDERSKLIVHSIADRSGNYNKASENLRFASAVASFGMLLRNSEFKGNASYATVLNTARNAALFDKEGYRKEFVQLVDMARLLAVNNNEQGNDNAVK